MYILQENNEIKTFFKESENAITEESKRVEARVVKALQGIGKQNFRNEIVDTLKQLEVEEKYAPNGKDNFLLFSFASEMVDLGRVNLGDYVQTLAVQNALDKTFGSCNYDFYDRNALIYYDSKHSPLRNNAVVVMQGWFANLNQKWLPNDSLKPVYVGTHWTNGTIQYLRHLLIYRPHYFNGLEIGCRDLWTLENCYKLGIKAYFSRCLTLTFPKRVETPKQNKVFLVGIPKEWLQYIPQDLIKDAEVIEQQSVRLDGVYMHQRYYEATSELLERYRNEARLVITRALHCAAPCTAMGIPAVLIAKDPKENMTRFTAVDGILPIYTLQDLQEGKVDFNPCILDIEDLKQLMLENLKMSIQKARGEKVDEEKLCEIRKGIMEYRVCKNKMVNNVEWGGGADSCLVVLNKNTWKENFEYSLEFVERYKILLDLLPRAKKYKKIQSVLDIGCGKQYLRDVLEQQQIPIQKYVGIDLYLHKKDTIICDLNNEKLPKVGSFDLVVCAGLFEYIYDIKGLLKQIFDLKPFYILCSYNFYNLSLVHNPIWVKDMATQKEMLDYFMETGYNLFAYKTDENKKYLQTGYFLFASRKVLEIS